MSAEGFGVVEGELSDVVEGIVVLFFTEVDGFFLGEAELADFLSAGWEIDKLPVVDVEGGDEVFDGALVGDGLEGGAARIDDGDDLGFFEIAGRDVAVICAAAAGKCEEGEEQGDEEKNAFHGWSLLCEGFCFEQLAIGPQKAAGVDAEVGTGAGEDHATGENEIVGKRLIVCREERR